MYQYEIRFNNRKDWKKWEDITPTIYSFDDFLLAVIFCYTLLQLHKGKELRINEVGSLQGHYYNYPSATAFFKRNNLQTWHNIVTSFEAAEATPKHWYTKRISLAGRNKLEAAKLGSMLPSYNGYVSESFETLSVFPEAK